MAVDERRRQSLYESAAKTWTKEDADTLLESLPHPALDLATRRDIADLRGELRGEIEDLRAEMHDLLRVQTRRLSGVLIAGMGVAAAIGRLG